MSTRAIENQVAGIVYRNICTRSCTGNSKVKVGHTSKGDGKQPCLWDFQMPTDKQVMASQPDNVVNKVDTKSLVIDLNHSKKEHYKLEKYHNLRETWRGRGE